MITIEFDARSGLHCHSPLIARVDGAVVGAEHIGARDHLPCHRLLIVRRTVITERHGA